MTIEAMILFFFDQLSNLVFLVIIERIMTVIKVHSTINSPKAIANTITPVLLSVIYGSTIRDKITRKIPIAIKPRCGNLIIGGCFMMCSISIDLVNWYPDTSFNPYAPFVGFITPKQHLITVDDKKIKTLSDASGVFQPKLWGCNKPSGCRAYSCT
jgi:hypothetical protein